MYLIDICQYLYYFWYNLNVYMKETQFNTEKIMKFYPKITILEPVTWNDPKSNFRYVSH